MIGLFNSQTSVLTGVIPVDLISSFKKNEALVDDNMDLGFAFTFTFTLIGCCGVMGCGVSVLVTPFSNELFISKSRSAPGSTFGDLLNFFRPLCCC